MQQSNLLNQPGALIFLLVWSFVWKGWALWKAASKKQLLWFILILIVNTFGILEIAYIFFLNRWDLDNGRSLKFFQKQFKKKS